ncbi:MAG: hypothetical protein IT317_01470 [Anaerolineales bacterium]|nr:hypothetical protein [Anaerolineales bacterium]
MLKTIAKNDPSLLAAVARLRRVQQVWGLLLILWGVITAYAGGSAHPLAGLPFIAIGLLALLWREPALLAAVATLMAFAIVPGLNPRLTVLGPDPVVIFGQLSWLETAAIVVGKLLIVLTAANQFFLYRFLYGTERATTSQPDLAIIPAMVPNRTDGLARAARLMGMTAAGLGALAVLLTFVDATAYLPSVLAEMAGSLGVTALGLGLGAAFSPTDERPAALLAAMTGLLGYALCAVALIRLG